MRDAQEVMSSTASNYNVTRLLLGTALAFLTCVLSFFTLPPLRPLSSAGLYYFLTLGLYIVLMFASSYVEEEHNFWYWITSGWFFYLFLGSMRKEWLSTWIFHPALMVLVIHRVVRRWNQTGQKFAGADDIVTSGIFHGNNSILLWSLIGATYMDVTVRISRHVSRSVATFDTNKGSRTPEPQPTEAHRMIGTIAVLPLCGTAFVFKLAFTAKDAPELTSGITASLMGWIGTLDLVGLAQMVFGGLLLSFGWILFAEHQRSTRRIQKCLQGHGGTFPFSFLCIRHSTNDVVDLAIAFFDLTTLFLFTQTKAQNIPLYLLFRFQFFFLCRPPSPSPST
jgi:ethanolaminephosphotransferase